MLIKAQTGKNQFSGGKMNRSFSNPFGGSRSMLDQRGASMKVSGRDSKGFGGSKPVRSTSAFRSPFGSSVLKSREPVKQVSEVSMELLSEFLIGLWIERNGHGDEDVIEILMRDSVERKGIWDSKRKRSVFNVFVDDYVDVVTALEKIQYLKVVRLPSMVEKIFVTKEVVCFDKFSDENDIYLSVQSTIPKLWNHLFDYQKVGVSFGVKRGGKLLIGDGMGLGKTVQAISIASYFISDWPLLIICPASVQSQWVKEIEKWVDNTVVSILKSNSKPKDHNLTNNNVYIASYSVASNIPNLDLFCNDCIVVDESHYLKSSQAKRTKILIPFITKTRRAILLTGTAVLSRPVEIFTQLNALMPEVFPDYFAFGRRYCGDDDDFTGASNLSELNLLLTNTIMIRRLKEDIKNEIPPKKKYLYYLGKQTQEILDLEDMPTPTISENEHGDLFFSNEDEIMDEYFGSDISSKQDIMREYQKNGAEKLPEILDFLIEYISMHPTKKILFFAHHQAVLDGVSSAFPLKSQIRIDGSTEKGKRQELVDHFHRDNRCTLAVLSITAAGTGLNLACSSTVIFGELYWNPGILLQAEDRAHRLGQKNEVHIIYLIRPNTIDQTIWNLIKSKIKVVTQTLDGHGETKNLFPSKR